MLHIAICDDIVDDLHNINRLTMNLLALLNVEYKINLFTNGNDLLKHPVSFDLIILYIEMEDIDGIETARKLRQYDKEVRIILIANSGAYLQVGYTVRGDRYLIKPLDKEEFNSEVGIILKSHVGCNRYIIDKRVSPYKLYLKDIIYIEFLNRKSIVYKHHETITTNLSLKDWIELLKHDNFSRIHKSYIINIQHIDSYNGDELVLCNEKKLSISRTHKESFRKNYFSFISKKS